MYKIVGLLILLLLPFNSIPQIKFVNYDDINNNRYKINIVLKKIDTAIRNNSFQKAKILLDHVKTYSLSKNRIQTLSKKLSYAIKVAKQQKRKTTKQKQKQKQKTVYLTFDDGPMKGTTKVIDVINKEKVPVTMFVVGAHINSSKLYKSYYNQVKNSPYMLLANHTYSHAHDRYNWFYTSGYKNIIKDINKNHILLKKDVKPNSPPYTRLAGRNVYRLPTIKTNDPYISKRQLKRERKSYDAIWNAGFYLYGWDIEWSLNARTNKYRQTASQIAQKIEYMHKNNLSTTKNKIVVLMHDIMFQDRYKGKQKLTKLIKILKKNNWKFETIETYLTSVNIKNSKYTQNVKLYNIEKFITNKTKNIKKYKNIKKNNTIAIKNLEQF
ncbi:MAG: hypothetical protein DRG11_01815 [Epsilonproteobacteria bacterium]|nr:MAG: hypothetical protein DRG11_01815 [Campylobacterota bacterium]